MLSIRVKRDSVQVGKRFEVSFHRTLRVPDDGRTYPLPPGLGRLPVHSVSKYLDRVPPRWKEPGGVFIPLYQREALWLGFDAAHWKPNAVKVAVGGVNAVTGETWTEGLRADTQNYIVCPDQPWLDGINTGEGLVSQFVAMPLGSGYSVEAQITGAEELGGIQVTVYDAKPGRFPDRAPRQTHDPNNIYSMKLYGAAMEPQSAEMGIAAGGQIGQKIYPDTHGLDVWDQSNYATLFVHIVNSEQYHSLTGLRPPPTPIDASTYAEYGLPWFALYDDDRKYLAPSEVLSVIETVKQQDQQRGIPLEPAESDTLLIPDSGNIIKLRPESSGKHDSQGETE